MNKVKSKINTKMLRKKLGLTQREFCKTYHIKLETLRYWEQKKTDTTGSTKAFLFLINEMPEKVEKTLKKLTFLEENS